MFVLSTHTGKQIQLLWDYYSILLYCRSHNIDLVGFGEHLSRLNTDLSVLTGFIQSAAYSATDKEPTEREVAGWIMESGGINAMNQGPLYKFVNYVIEQSIVKTSEEVTTEKKSS